jgi:hypothetical protein
MDPHQNCGDPHLLQHIRLYYSREAPARVNTAEAGASNTVALGAAAEGKQTKGTVEGGRRRGWGKSEGREIFDPPPNVRNRSTPMTTSRSAAII